ncbi:hypothetical protein C2G38_2156355 [Gigaspora rosea]|uniref:HTH psq-type domain-containing protein n=1 Tax=Gigaspora rosea TaxID=44941 RepID=A0A397W4R4_9GLOM|nr:hypothetical protein C2G38_2156355 [Gigaspora rosea]
MPEVSYLNKQSTILTAINELNNHLAGHKRPSVHSVVKNFGIPKTTLRCAAKNGGPPKHRGPSTILTEYEENQLVDKWPERDWWTRFMRDHFELSFRAPQELSEACAQRANATIVNDHFNKLKQVINQIHLQMQIWNMDETGFVLVPKLEKVVAKKGSSTGIWPFNPKTISSDCLDTSLATEIFDIIPDQFPFGQSSHPVMLSPQPISKPTTHSHYTHTNFTQLASENEILKKEDANEETERKAEEMKWKKEIAAKKKEIAA